MHTSTPPAAKSNDIMGYVRQIEALGDEYLVKKAPFTLPPGVKDFIVKLAYPLAIVGAVLMIIAIVGAVVALILFMGISAVSLPFAGSDAIPELNILGLVLAALQIALTLLSIKVYFQALPGLKSHTRMGWQYVFYGYLLSAVSNLLSTHSIPGVVFGLIPAAISTLIGLYTWFQVKDRYTH